MRPSLLVPLALLLLASACQEKKPDWAKAEAAGAGLPPQVCAQVKKSLDALTKNGGVEYTNNGEATLPAEAWPGMTAEQHDQLARTLAYHAACAAGETSDAQPVTIRGDDGSVLLRRTISTKLDASDLTGGE
ncbi:MAG TPA: hypothetical protein VGD66_06855 [Allosphingosinicella sp.]|jgi:hypothetical protein